MVFITVECTVIRKQALELTTSFIIPLVNKLLYCSRSVGGYVIGAVFVNSYASEKRCITVEGL